MLHSVEFCAGMFHLSTNHVVQPLSACVEFQKSVSFSKHLLFVITPFLRIYTKFLYVCNVASASLFSFRTYIKHGSPVKMMECYIAVLIKGICQSDENGSFLIKDYDVRKAYLAGSLKG